MVADAKNYFNILGIRPAFCIDDDELNAKYLDLQMQVHPDVSGIDSDSSVVNFAYNLLLDPIKRAEHLLELSGYKCDKSYGCPIALFEIQEKLSESDTRERNDIIDNLQNQLNKTYHEIKELLDNPLDDSAVDAICEKINNAKYIRKMLD